MSDKAIEYETVLPKVFYQLDELARDHDEVLVATAAFEWTCEHLKRADWTEEQIKAHLIAYFDPTPPVGSA